MDMAADRNLGGERITCETGKAPFGAIVMPIPQQFLNDHHERPGIGERSQKIPVDTC
jgi:hypothetical protein